MAAITGTHRVTFSLTNFFLSAGLYSDTCLCLFQAVRSFQVALHLNPLACSLWEEDLRWALHLREEKRAVQQKARQDDQMQRLMNEAPELQQDYGDFECDEVIAACTAIADRQKRYEELKRNVIVDVQDAMVVRNSDINASKYILIKARII